MLELACGVGSGMTRLAQAYPASSFVGLDGDAYSLQRAGENFRAAGLSDRLSTIHSTLEDLDAADEYDVTLINVSMHECRDIERVTANIHRALNPGGLFVISDFPFPASHDGMRTPPARVMSGIQFFEALIDDQLLPTQAFVDLLGRHGFENVGSFDLTAGARGDPRPEVAAPAPGGGGSDGGGCDGGGSDGGGSGGRR